MKRITAVFAMGLATALVFPITDSLARLRTAAAMAEGAHRFLDSLGPEQRAKAVFAFADEQRMDWHFIPRARPGIPLKELNEEQRRLAHEFLKTGVSALGYRKASTIISLEPVLAELEGPGRRQIRDQELYYFSVFGSPSATEPWGWRMEGHHLSLNFTVVRGELVSNTPLFLGANPAEIRQGPRKGLRALAGEEDKGRALVRALDASQRALAVFSDTAPRDIITTNSRKADPLQPAGIAGEQLTPRQRELLTELLEEYLAGMPDDLAGVRRSKLQAAGLSKVHFAWAGGLEPSQAHYYRLQGPTFLVEYDDTQNNANHIHTVWRDFDGDFGADLLSQHYRTAAHAPWQ